MCDKHERKSMFITHPFFQSDPPADAPFEPDDSKPPQTWEEIFKHKRFKQLNENYTKASDELKQLRADAQKKESDELKEKENWKTLFEKTQKDLDVERVNNLRMKVGVSKNLPVELIERLQGTTEGELNADAEKLLGFVQVKGTEKPEVKGIPPKSKDGQPVKTTGTPDEIRKNTREIIENSQNYVKA